MPSTNPYFTFHYSQPEEYRFSHDSVFMARKVYELGPFGDSLKWRGLDLCAGSGIIGLDFLFHSGKNQAPLPSAFDFCEVQSVYHEHFEKNREALALSAVQTRFLNLNYAELLKTPGQEYDLIVCNPPYFRPEQGKLSPSEFKNRCRFFLDSDFKTLIEVMAHVLSKNGAAYFLLRDLKDHGFHAQAEARHYLPRGFNLDFVTDIRGTALMSIKRDAR